MRKALAALLFTLLLAGCAAPAGEKASAASAPRMSSAPVAQAENMSSSMVESSARPMPEAEVTARKPRRAG